MRLISMENQNQQNESVPIQHCPLLFEFLFSGYMFIHPRCSVKIENFWYKSDRESKATKPRLQFIPLLAKDNLLGIKPKNEEYKWELWLRVSILRLRC